MTSPLSPAQLLKYLYDDLTPWVAARKGYLSIAGDPGEVLEYLADGPQSFRVVLAWQGDQDQAGTEYAGITENTFEVWLIKSKGLPVTPGIALIKGDPAFLDLLSDLRARVRSLQFPEEATSQQLFYKSARQFEPELALTLPTTGYKMEFTLVAAVPFLASREI